VIGLVDQRGWAHEQVHAHHDERRGRLLNEKRDVRSRNDQVSRVASFWPSVLPEVVGVADVTLQPVLQRVDDMKPGDHDFRGRDVDEGWRFRAQKLQFSPVW